jgi:hypothetical protein
MFENENENYLYNNNWIFQEELDVVKNLYIHLIYGAKQLPEHAQNFMKEAIV